MCRGKRVECIIPQINQSPAEQELQLRFPRLVLRSLNLIQLFSNISSNAEFVDLFMISVIFNQPDLN
jgi:hypothetical protein